MSEAFLSYRYNDAAQTSYEYFWNDFCDWYVEATKLSVKNGNEKEKDRAATVLLDVLSKSLQLLHPLLPFVTEEIYQKLPHADGVPLLINSRYPEYDEKIYCPEEEKNFSCLQSLVSMVRTLRSECGVTPDKKLRVLVRTSDKGSGQEKSFRQNEGLIKLLGGIEKLEVAAGESAERPAGSIGMAGTGFEVFVFIAEAVDTAALKKKFISDLERDSKYIDGLRAKLANEQFVKNAPAQLVEEQKNKLEETLKRTGKFTGYLKDL
jgi:valyl-tRNA synthetase